MKTWKRFRTCPELKMPKTVEFGANNGLVQWSRDGRYLLTSWEIYYDFSNIYYTYFPTPPTAVSLWRASDGKKLASLWLQNPHGRAPFDYDSFELQNDGRVLAVSLEGHAFLDQLATLSSKSKQPLSLPKETITAATMSSDGTYLAVGTSSGKVFRKRLK